MKHLTILLFLFGVSPLWAQTKRLEFDHQHSLWNQVLTQYVIKIPHSSRVKYKALKASPQTLNMYLSQISNVSPSQYEKWSKPQKVAFLINAYNAFTLKLIIDHFPIQSIKKIGGWFSNPWKKKFFTFLGKKSYLDHIEHEILRKQFSEPRIHFAVNCASIGCPSLRNQAYTAEKLEDQLKDQTVTFLTDPQRNFIKGKKLHISKIFKWYKEDFVKASQSVSRFVAPYITTDPKTREKLQKEEYSISYTHYDWGLNKAKK